MNKTKNYLPEEKKIKIQKPNKDMKYGIRVYLNQEEIDVWDDIEDDIIDDAYDNVGKFDIDRMKEALSQEDIDVPANMHGEELRQFILNKK